MCKFLLHAGKSAAVLCLLALAGCDDDKGNAAPPVTAFTQPTSNFCSATADLLFSACGAEVTDDLFAARAICINIADAADRDACLGEAETVRMDEIAVCSAQQSGRKASCASTGEARYDPELDPADFQAHYVTIATPNPYFPLRVGNTWAYEGGSETNNLTVLNETKLIEGLTAVVVRDEVFDDGDLVEDTDDWFALTTGGDVWYLGEEVKDYESFDGDVPFLPELVSIDGSFKHGRDGDKGGLFFAAAPTVGQFLIEEFSLGNAEDVTEVLSTSYRYGLNAELDRGVPQALAEMLCPSAGDCIVTKNYSLLEPGIFARKYYARGLGVFAETDPQAAAAGDRLKAQLVGCNFDPRCDTLPPAAP